jgi:hypothetical protein
MKKAIAIAIAVSIVSIIGSYVFAVASTVSAATSLSAPQQAKIANATN